MRFHLLRYGEPTWRCRTVHDENITGLRGPIVGNGCLAIHEHPFVLDCAHSPMLSTPDALAKILETESKT